MTYDNDLDELEAVLNGEVDEVGVCGEIDNAESYEGEICRVEIIECIKHDMHVATPSSTW